MPYEVFSPFSSCADYHGHHWSLQEAAACLAQIALQIDRDMPVHPITGKHIHAIAAVDTDGTQRNFGQREKQTARRLNLDPRSLLTDKPAVTTISHLARIYFEATSRVPMLTVEPEKLFDYSDDRRNHFWTTDAGKGQSLAYILQAAFTLELSLKAILEVGGKLAHPNDDGRPDWKNHKPAAIFKLLDESEQKKLEEQWQSLASEARNFYGTYLEFLKSVDDIYTGMRYLQKASQITNTRVEVLTLLSASRIALDLAFVSFRQRSPIKPKVTVTTYRDTAQPAMRPELVQGIVRTVRIPEGFDPHSQVEVLIERNDGGVEVTALFRKADVENYWGIEGDQIAIVGYSSDVEPFILHHSQHRDRRGESGSASCYTNEARVLQGSVYDLQTYEIQPGQHGVRLVLDDCTYWTKVQCMFSTQCEREQLSNIQLGDEILVNGLVSLRDGRPLILIDPQIVYGDIAPEGSPSRHNG